LEQSIRFPDTAPLLRTAVTEIPAAGLIRQRRSALAFDGITTITRQQFDALLDKTLPRNGVAPFDAELGAAEVDLALFVHRVEGLMPGLYWLLREPGRLADLKRTLQRYFLWEKVDGPLPLYLLMRGDMRDAAVRVSCFQTIAGDSAFSLGMV